MHMEGGGKKTPHSSYMYNEGNVFVQFVWLGESMSYIVYLKGAEAAHFDFPVTENDAEMILQLIWEWLMYNQLLSCRCWAPSSLWWMMLSIPVVPFRFIDLSLRHVSATWPGHYGCDPDARGRHRWNLDLSQGAAGGDAKLSENVWRLTMVKDLHRKTHNCLTGALVGCLPFSFNKRTLQ